MSTMQYQKRRNNNGFVVLRAVLVACYAMINVQSFSIVIRQVEQTSRNHQHINLQSHFSSFNNKPSRSLHTIQYMAGDDNENSTDKSSDASEVEIVSVSEEVVEITESTDDEQNENDEETKQLQEEIEAETKKIKEEINQLEMDLKGKRRNLDYYNDLADEYTKAGYARKVAEMENMRRTRSSLASSNKFTATASTLTEFLPILDSVETLREKYGEDTFGKQYNAVSGSIKSALSELGVTSFEFNAGDIIDDPRKIDIIESQYSIEYPKKGSVIQVISNGMELKGNIIRPAKCIVSLGVEEKVESTDEEVSDNVDTEAAVEEESATK